ncbi:MAG: hypothetical protein IPJ46_07380 [Anaerolineales bacterium]|nr:hypothetical protein [Anaerolineales bacterium]
MKTIGVWIDHKKAVIVIQSEQGEDIQTIESGVEKLKYRGAAHPRSKYSAQYQQGDDQLDNKFTEQLNKYYEKVIEQFRSAEAVLIIGPGEAKRELEKRMAHHKVNAPILGVESADKLTDRQIAARVRNYFQEAEIA